MTIAEMVFMNVGAMTTMILTLTLTVTITTHGDDGDGCHANNREETLLMIMF
jgi:hypothetical protein